MSVRAGFVEEVACRVRNAMATAGKRAVVTVIGDDEGRAALSAALTPDELHCIEFESYEDSRRQAWESLSRDLHDLFMDDP